MAHLIWLLTQTIPGLSTYLATLLVASRKATPEFQDLIQTLETMFAAWKSHKTPETDDEDEEYEWVSGEIRVEIPDPFHAHATKPTRAHRIPGTARRTKGLRAQSPRRAHIVTLS